MAFAHERFWIAAWLNSLQTKLLRLDPADLSLHEPGINAGWDPPQVSTHGGCLILTHRDGLVFWSCMRGLLYWLNEDLSVRYTHAVSEDVVFGPTSDNELLVMQEQDGWIELKLLASQKEATVLARWREVPWDSASGLARAANGRVAVLDEKGDLFVTPPDLPAWSRVRVPYPSLLWEAYLDEAQRGAAGDNGQGGRK